MARQINFTNKKAANDYFEKKLKSKTIPEWSAKTSCELASKIIEGILDTDNELDINKSDITYNVSTSTSSKNINIFVPVEVSKSQISKYYSDKDLKYLDSIVKVMHIDGSSKITITVNKSSTFIVLSTFVSAVFGAAIALLARVLLDSNTINAIYENCLSPIIQLFINSLLMISTPVTFFAIVCTVAFSYRSLKNGTLRTRLLLRYILSGFVAFFIGATVQYFVIPSVSNDTLLFFTNDENFTTPYVDIDISQISPDNIIKPFINGDSLQVLFIALLIGFAVGALSTKESFTLKLTKTINNIFIHVLNLIFELSPVLLFLVSFTIFSILQVDELAIVGFWFLSILLGLFMLIVLRLVIVLASGQNLALFLKKYKPFILPVAISGSTIASIPSNISNCKKAFNFPEDFLTRVITFCAHNNMDGNCMFIGVVLSPFLVLVPSDQLLGTLVILGVLSVVLSAGAPNQPGSGIICLGVLLPILNLNSHFMVHIVLLDLMCETLIACTNNFSDISTVFILGKHYESHNAKSW